MARATVSDLARIRQPGGSSPEGTRSRFVALPDSSTSTSSRRALAGHDIGSAHGCGLPLEVTAPYNHDWYWSPDEKGAGAATQ